jgi:hypothetical protein
VLAARLGLALFVVAWIFDLLGLRSYVPVWLPFLIALGLELQLFVGASRSAPPEPGGGHRLPQSIDYERYGYADLDDEEEEADEDEDDDVPQPRRALRRLLAGVAIAGALAGVVWLAGNRGWDGLDEETRAEATARFAREASRVVGRPVEIRCDEAGEFVGAVQHADGVAAVGGRLAYLTPEICHDLYRLAFRDDVTFSRTARAIAVLAHEAWHLRGERNEGVTECYALQSGVELGTRLGLDEDTARRMMRQQLAENQLRGRGSVEYLVPEECRDGGALDLDPGSSRFP